MAFYGNILEEELKNKVAHDYFSEFDTTQIVGKIDAQTVAIIIGIY